MMERLLEARDERGVVTLTLNRPERRNAFDGAVVAGLTSALTRVASSDGARVLVLQSTGPHFSAGADLEWMRAKAQASMAENEADAAAVLRMMRALDELPLPTLAVVQGKAFGGAVGLIACCDIVLAADDAVLALSEVRHGLSPVAIGPFVARAIGPRQARRYFVSAEPIPAERARAIGLLHEIVPRDELGALRDRVLASLLLGAPEAQAEAKAAAARSSGHASEPDASVARQVAARRARPEAREGMAAFLERRLPEWVSRS